MGRREYSEQYHHRAGAGAGAAIVVVVVAVAAAVVCECEAKPRAFFVFGDSLVDSGNNNNILSLARANYQPYGIDFTGAAPPGRFTNGLTVVDMLADMLGLRPPLIPAYAMAQPADFARGLNFASGAAGIRPETGNNLVSLVSTVQYGRVNVNSDMLIM